MVEDHPNPDVSQGNPHPIKGVDHEGALLRMSEAHELKMRGIYTSALLTLLPLLNVYLPRLLGPEQVGPVRIIENPYFNISSADFIAAAFGIVVAQTLRKRERTKSRFIFEKSHLLSTHETLGHEILAFSDVDPSQRNPDNPLNALLIRLPDYFKDNTLSHGGHDMDELLSQLLDAICADVAEKLRDNPELQYVYLTLNAQSQSLGDNHDHLSESDLLERYNLKTLSPSTQLIKLERQEMLDIARDPFDILCNAVEAIADPQLTLLYKLAQESGSEKRIEVVKLILTRIKGLLSHEIDRNFQVSYLARMAHDPDNPNVRYTGVRKVTPFTQLRRTDSGFFYVETDTDSGAIRTTALNELLKVSNQPIDDLLSSHSPYKRAQLLYVVDQLLRTTPLDELFQEKPTIEELQSALDAQQIITKSQNLEETLSIRPKIRKPRLGSLLKYVTFVMLAYPFAHYTKESVVNSLLSDHSRTFFNGEYASEFSSPISAEFPPMSPVWQISSTLDTQGKYWIENIYDGFYGSQPDWSNIRNLKSEPEIQYPRAFDETEPHIKLSRTIGRWEHTQFDIPIMEGTKLSALTVEEEDGTPIPIHVTADETGVLRAHLDEVKVGPMNNLRLTIYLEQTDRPVYKPKGEIMAFDTVYDEPQYNDAAKKLINHSLQLVVQGRYETFDEALTEVIRQTYEYGIDADGNEILKTADSRDDFINKAANLDKMHCNTANSLLALLAVNKSRHYATGYQSALVRVTDDGEPDQGFLVNTSAHGFTIDDTGKILDATPTKVSTENAGPSADFEKMEEKWTMIHPEYNKAKKQEDLQDAFNEDARMVGEILLGLGGIYGAMQMSRILKRHMTAENRDAVIDTAFTKWQGDSHLKLALQFLTYISFGAQDSPYTGTTTTQLLNTDTLTYLRRNIHHGRVAEYVENPEKYEPADWSNSQRNHQRQIASFLLLHP